jgi:hypothetical protein
MCDNYLAQPIAQVQRARLCLTVACVAEMAVNGFPLKRGLDADGANAPPVNRCAPTHHANSPNRPALDPP